MDGLCYTESMYCCWITVENYKKHDQIFKLVHLYKNHEAQVKNILGGISKIALDETDILFGVRTDCIIDHNGNNDITKSIDTQNKVKKFEKKVKNSLPKVNATEFFVVQAVGEIISGRSVSKIKIIFLSFRVSISKNKNADHRVKQTCAIRSIKATYEIDHISLLRDSTMSSALNFCYVFYCNIKEKYHIRKIINSKKINIYTWNQYYYFDLPKMRVSRARATKN